MQGLLETLDVPYVGAGVTASAVCIDKVLFKELMGATRPAHASTTWGCASERLRRAREEVLDGDRGAAACRCSSSRRIWARRWASSRSPTASASEDALELGVRPRRARDRRGDGAGRRGRVRRARQAARGAIREPTAPGRSSRSPGEISFAGDWYDFAGEVHAGGDGAEGARTHLRDGRTPGAGSRGCSAFVHAGCDGLARVDFFVDGERGGGERAEHDARLHPDERVREADGRPRASPTRSSSIASAGWHSSATRRGGPTGIEPALGPAGSGRLYLNNVRSAIEADSICGGSVVIQIR